MKFIHWIFFLSFLINNQLQANGYIISGYVADSKSNQSLIGANIFIVGTSLGSATDEKGFYKITNVEEGQYELKVTYIGYKTSSDSVNINPKSKFLDGKNYTKNFELNYTTIEGNEVIVTAQAKGQMTAINKQLNAKSLVNIISSDRIRELPDANVAETVARIPGVSIKREGGEGNKVIVRGLSPKYNSITVDGTRLASTDSDDRSTDLSMISQNVLEGIEVTKAGTPDLDADVLGGTINFKLRKAKPGLHATAIMQGIHNGLRNTYNDNKLVFDISNRFWKDRIGVLGQIDLDKRNRGSNDLGASYNNAGAIEVDSLNELTLTNFNLDNTDRINDRENSLFVVDINIPNGNISYSNLNSKIAKEIDSHSYLYSLQNSFGTGTNGSKNIISSKIDNSIKVLTENWKYKQTLFSKFNLETYFSFTQSSNTLKDYNFNFLERNAFSENPNGKDIEKLQAFSNNDEEGTLWNGYSFSRDFSDEKENTFGYDIQYDFKISSLFSGKVKIGNKNRSKKRLYDRNYESGNATRGDNITMGSVSDTLKQLFPQIQEYSPLGWNNFSFLSFVDSDYDHENFQIEKYNFGPVADLDLLVDCYNFLSKNYYQYAPGTSLIPEAIVHVIHQTNSIMYDYRGEEEYRASYGMIDLDIGSKINVVSGIRQETNTTLYTAYRSQQSAQPNLVFTGDEYTHKRKNSYSLPALFLRYRPTDWLNIRTAWTNTLTRPNYSDIIPLQEYLGTASAVDWRNQDLEPGESENRDFSISLNQDRIGFMSFGYFTKNIKNLIFSSGRLYIGNPSEFGLPDNVEKWQILNYTDNNSYEVLLNGFELDYQTRFWYLPGILNGLVLNANYTFIESNVKYPRNILDQFFDWDATPPGVITTVIDTFYLDRLIDQPREIINISLGYDYKGFSGRLSMLYKTDVFKQSNFWPELRESTDDYRRWDLSVKQKLPIKGLELFFNGSNLTEATDVNRFRGSTNVNVNEPALTLEQYYGKTFDLGFKYFF